MWESSSQGRYHLTLCNLHNFGTSNTLLCPLLRLKLQCSRVTIHLFLLWSIIHCRDKNLEYSGLKGDIAHIYCSTFLNHNENQMNLSSFFSAKARRHISVPEERGDVWKKEKLERHWDSSHLIPLVSLSS